MKIRIIHNRFVWVYWISFFSTQYPNQTYWVRKDATEPNQLSKVQTNQFFYIRLVWIDWVIGLTHTVATPTWRAPSWTTNHRTTQLVVTVEKGLEFPCWVCILWSLSFVVFHKSVLRLKLFKHCFDPTIIFLL